MRIRHIIATFILGCTIVSSFTPVANALEEVYDYNTNDNDVDSSTVYNNHVKKLLNLHSDNIVYEYVAEKRGQMANYASDYNYTCDDITYLGKTTQIVNDFVNATTNTPIASFEDGLRVFYLNVKGDNNGKYPIVDNKPVVLLDGKSRYDSTVSDILSIQGHSRVQNYTSAIFIDTDNNRIIFRLYGWGGESILDGSPYGSYKDWDLTPVLSAYANDKELSNYHITAYLCSLLSEVNEQKVNKSRDKQEEIFKKYAQGSTSKRNDANVYNWFNSVNSKLMENKSETVADSSDPKVSADLNRLSASRLYFVALSKAGLYSSLDFTKIITETNLPIESFDGFYYNVEGTTKYDLLTAVQTANGIVDKYKRSSPYYTEPSLEANAVMFDSLTKYFYGIFTQAPVNSSGANAADQRLSLSTLDNLCMDISTIQNNYINPALWEQVATMNTVQGGFQYEDLYRYFIMLQNLEYYSEDSSISGIEVDDTGAIHNTKLEEEIANAETNKTEDGKYPEVKDGDVIRQIRAYKAIHDGLSYAGIEPWTEKLSYICEKYDVISKFPLSEELDEYNTESETEPLKAFFTIEGEKKLSNNYLTGVALSSTFIPMVTNLYDATATVRVLKNEDWLSQFHIKYGFHRKALMIDTNVNAAVDRYFQSGKNTGGQMRVATLSDLLEPEKDIVLYVDDNFYNTDEVAEIYDKTYNRLANTEQASIGEDDFSGWLDRLFNNSIENILKTGPEGKYDESTIEDVKEYGKEGKISWASITESLFTDGTIMTSGRDGGKNEIKENIDKTDYDVQQSYAVVSGIYRHKKLARNLNTIAENPIPVFISSPTIHNITGVTKNDFRSIYNYAMLKNLEASLGVDYRTTLDVDNPLYIDIYGNITTESGLVVIPAASNSTLYTGETYTPYTLGFMYLYSKGEYIKVPKNFDIEDENNNYVKYLTDFTVDEDGKYFVQNNYEFNGVPVNPVNPSVSDEALLEELYNKQISILNDNGYIFNQRIWLITEVLRGAPIEYIDKQKEGISGKRDINKYGLYMSYKLDEIAEAVLPTSNGNSLISMPNIAFMSGIEYVVLFLVKFMILCFVGYILYNIYLDAVSGQLGLSTFGRCISTIVIFAIAITSLPSIVSMSYNETQKILLQPEIAYVNLLNQEKNLEGREISAVGVEEPKSETQLYLRVDKIKVPWYKLIGEVMFAPIGKSLSEVYEEEMKDNILYGFDDVQIKNDGAYIDVNDVFNASSIMYNVDNHFLYQYMNTSPTASYFMPYYYIMDNLLSSINRYNQDNGIINISTKIQSDGSVKTIGMIGDYLLSEYFMFDDNDPLGLKTLYGLDLKEQKDFINVEDPAIQESMWYNTTYSDDEMSSRIDQLYSHLRAYVAKNHKMIGRVTDETFLKTMVLDMAMEYNNIMKIPACRRTEVFSIDARDIIRLSVADDSTTIVNSSYSFGRFIYEVGGGLGVILTAILLGILFVTSIVKPLLVIFLGALLIYNVLIKTMLRLGRTKTIEGLLYVLSILVIVNSLYAIVVKLTMFLPELGLNSVLSIIAQIVIQLLYLFIAFKLVVTIMQDYDNMGFNIFHSMALAMVGKVGNQVHKVQSKFMYSGEQNSYMDSARIKSEEESRAETESLEEEMKKRDDKRDSASEEKAFYDRVFDDSDSTK